MNKLIGEIKSIVSCKGVSLVEIQTRCGILKTILLDEPQNCEYLKKGRKITAIFKETEVAIGLLGIGDISISNQLICRVQKINYGEILTEVTLTCEGAIITSIITTNSSKKVNLKENLEVIALIKANEVSIVNRLLDVF